MSFPPSNIKRDYSKVAGIMYYIVHTRRLVACPTVLVLTKAAAHGCGLLVGLELKAGVRHDSWNLCNFLEKGEFDENTVESLTEPDHACSRAKKVE